MKVSLSKKIAVLFTVFIFVTVVLFSTLLIGLLRNSILAQRIENLRFNLTLIETVLSEIPPGSSLSAELQSALLLAGIPYYISYTVYRQVPTQERTVSESGRGFSVQEENPSSYLVLATNDPYIPFLPLTSGARHYVKKDFFSDGDLDVLYMAREKNGFFFQTALFMDMDSVSTLLYRLPLIILFSTAPLLILSFFAALFFAKKMLKPVSHINQTAREISASNLDRRVPVSGAGDEIEELAHTFNQLFSRLQEDFQRERRFTADVSHELKTPLAVLLGHSHLLRRWGKSDPRVLDSSLEAIYDEAARMRHLVENMLLLSRNDLKKNEEKCMEVPQKRTIFSVLEKVAEDFTLVRPDVKIQIKCPVDAGARCGPETLTQVLRILLENSATYCSRPAEITLVFESSGKLTIYDNGDGINEKDLPLVFDRLYRSDQSRSRKTGGLGLGLSIAKSLLESEGASIYAQSPAFPGNSNAPGTAMIIVFAP